MERLTERIENIPDGESSVWVKDHDYIAAAEKLAKYEDMEEQGLLLRLTINENKKIYIIKYKWSECTEYGETYYDCENYNCDCVCDSKKEYYIIEVSLMYLPICSYQDSLGKTWFITKEKAEKKLKELNNEA